MAQFEVAFSKPNFNPPYHYTAAHLAGLVQCNGGSVHAECVRRKLYGFILIAPVKRSSIVLGQLLEAVLLSLIESAILLVLSMIMSVRIASGFAGLLLIPLLVFLAAFFMSGLSYAISLCLVNEAIYETIMNLIVLSIFFTSTALFPMDGISGGLKIAVMINPFTHIINSLRSLILGTSVDWQNLLLVATLFICLCLGSFALAHWRLKKETTN